MPHKYTEAREMLREDKTGRREFQQIVREGFAPDWNEEPTNEYDAMRHALSWAGYELYHEAKIDADRWLVRKLMDRSDELRKRAAAMIAEADEIDEEIKEPEPFDGQDPEEYRRGERPFGGNWIAEPIRKETNDAETQT